ncbi:lysophospholipid acyltransferase family protein [candidate division KSB1 bacterium]|nr:lysophospholipid acyltransferase family protein [candidate division KSB1 bacterium]
MLSIKLVWLLILFFGNCARIRLKNRIRFDRLAEKKRGFLIVLWHGKMLLPIFVHRGQDITAMVSEHRDGEMIARSIHRLGYRTVRGSSTRGGLRAFQQMAARLRKAEVCALMPDGPRGPRHRLKMGTVLMAQRSGCPILPMTFAAKWAVTLKTWDGFTLWLPFSKTCVLYGKPLYVPPQLSAEEMELWRQKIENALNRLEEEARAVF